MTYKLEPSLEKIESHVVLIFPNGERRSYQNGAAVTEATFDQKFVVKALRAFENTVEIDLIVPEMRPPIRNSEEQTFF